MSIEAGSAPPPRPGRGGTALDLGAIEASLRDLAEQFPRVNSALGSPRDPLERVTVDAMVSGYALVDDLIGRGIDLFSLGQLRTFLELNALVLCGPDERVRSEARQHLAATERHFYDNAEGGIRDIIEWHALHAAESAWMRAAGVYIRILSEPELFIEGNHRTGALVMSYILVRAGHPPFVLTIENAKTALDFSTMFTMKRKAGMALRWQMPWLKRRFAAFLQAQADPRFLRRT
ncbi:MAG: hypothetical protein HXX10_24525 [Rhodoplanes sp.]|uniref:hypothetical protein n=1 Tax=Rhodoplanes sp. TaxID=1968906 RepID=UPI0017978197|nr:hypothetical protein [Rhodoplanes sp.]NVO17204.1 hypothetical protein [Rhodoplanes sp.]